VSTTHRGGAGAARVACGVTAVGYVAGVVAFVLWLGPSQGSSSNPLWLWAGAVVAFVAHVVAIIVAIVSLVAARGGGPKALAITTIVLAVLGFVGVAALLFVGAFLLTPMVR